MKKDHLEVLLENIVGKVDLVLEGHTALDKKIDDVQASLDEHKQENKQEQRLILQMIKDLSQETKNLRKEFVDFRKENETAHLAINKKIDNLEQKVDNLEQKNEIAHTALDKKMDTPQKRSLRYKTKSFPLRSRPSLITITSPSV